MAGAANHSPAVGEIWLDTDFFEDGGSKSKFFLVLAVDKYDATIRTLTTKPKGRPATPACCHGPCFEGYCCGIIGGALYKESWIDLDDQDDVDLRQFQQRVTLNRYLLCAERLPPAMLCAALRCAAYGGNTQRAQSKKIMVSVSALRCP